MIFWLKHNICPSNWYCKPAFPKKLMAPLEPSLDYSRRVCVYYYLIFVINVTHDELPLANMYVIIIFLDILI